MASKTKYPRHSYRIAEALRLAKDRSERSDLRGWEWTHFIHVMDLAAEADALATALEEAQQTLARVRGEFSAIFIECETSPESFRHTIEIVREKARKNRDALAALLDQPAPEGRTE